MDNKDYIINQLISENAQLRVDNYNLKYQIEKLQEESEGDNSGEKSNATNGKAND